MKNHIYTSPERSVRLLVESQLTDYLQKKIDYDLGFEIINQTHDKVDHVLNRQIFFHVSMGNHLSLLYLTAYRK